MWIFLIILSISLSDCRLDSYLPDEGHLIDVSVTRLTTDNFKRITSITLPFKPEPNKQHFQSDWFIILYSPNCPHCKKALPQWNQFARSSLSQRRSSRYNTKIGAIDCTQNSALCHEFGITGYPTFLYLSKNYLKYQFLGQRTKTNFMKYLNQQSFDPTKIFYDNEQNNLHPFQKFLKYFTKTSIAIIVILLILVSMLLYGILDPLGTHLQHYYEASIKNQYQDQQDFLKVK